MRPEWAWIDALYMAWQRCWQIVRQEQQIVGDGTINDWERNEEEWGTGAKVWCNEMEDDTQLKDHVTF